jgi:lipopolysaccharide transport system ATP-binding protein
MAKPAVVVENVSKKFGISLKSALKYGLTDSLRRISGRAAAHHLRPGEFWALQGVNFTLEPGDALGIMGVNGSGKTTLLRILNGTYAPDSGKVTLRGRIGALIAAGAGFSPMLTGRENIYISGAVLGMTPREIRQRFDEIVDFSELAEFIDMPVRNYSSGMSVRLGFAVAALGSPDVLLVDEVLAVGDLSFQKKCFDRILQLKRQGTSIIFVSHAAGAVWSVCNRGIFLDRGIPKLVGAVEDVVRAYDDQNARVANGESRLSDDVRLPMNGHHSLPLEAGVRLPPPDLPTTGDAYFRRFRVLDPQTGAGIEEVPYGHAFAVEVDVEVVRPISDFVLRVTVDSAAYRNILALDSNEQGQSIGVVDPGRYRFRFVLPKPNLRPGSYTFHFSIIQRHVGVHTVLWLKCGQLVVLNPADAFFYSEPLAVVHIDAQVQREILDS